MSLLCDHELLNTVPIFFEFRVFFGFQYLNINILAAL